MISLSLRLAWRNVWRHRRRSILTVLAIAFATAVLQFFLAIQLKSYETSINATVSLFHGHLQIQRAGYLDKPRIRSTVPDVRLLAEKLSHNAFIEAVAPRAVGFALASSEKRSIGAQVTGIVPERERTVSTIPTAIREGRYLSSNSANEVVVGTLLARQLELSIGDDLTLLGQGREGSLAATVLPVVGIVRTGSNELDRTLVHLPLQTFQDVFDMGAAGHAIAIRTTDIERVEPFAAELRQDPALKDPLVVHTWNDLLPGLKQSIELDMAAGWLFYVSLIVVVMCTITNTFLMSVLERTKEFGVMLALGSTPFQIAKLILAESVILTLVGIGAGLALGTICVLYFGVYGFSVPGSEELAAQWNIPAVVHPDLTLSVISIAPALVIVGSFIAVLYPAFKIFLLRPVEAMR